MVNHTDPNSAPPVDPDIVEPALRALHACPWAIAAVAAGVVMFHGVSRDIQLNRGCQILRRRLHHVQHRSVETIRLIQRRRDWAGMTNAVGTLLLTVTAAAAGLAVARL